MRAVAPDVAPLIRATVYPLLRDCRVGKANGSRERAPDDRLRVPTTFSAVNLAGTARSRLWPPDKFSRG